MESGGGKLGIAIGAAGLAASSVWAVYHRIDSLVSGMRLLCDMRRWNACIFGGQGRVQGRVDEPKHPSFPLLHMRRP